MIVETVNDISLRDLDDDNNDILDSQQEHPKKKVTEEFNKSATVIFLLQEYEVTTILKM